MEQETIKNIAADFENLNSMPCNTIVHLQILTPTKAIRLKTRLIGIDPNMSVILAIRHENDWHTARNYMREGQGAIVRLLNLDSPDANIIAFRTTIQKIMSIAGNWLVLDYPQKELQNVSLRKYSRINIHIECAIIDKKSQKIVSTGFLHDISINGCAFIGNSLNEYTEESEYALQVTPDKQAPLICPITVKNGLEKEDHVTLRQYGLIFQENNKNTQDFIQKIILSHLSSSPISTSSDTPN